MSDFREVDFELSKLTQEQLDHAALHHMGHIGEMSGGNAIRAKIDPDKRFHGYRARWINTKGCGNAGTLILIPGDSRTFHVLRRGKINRIVDVLHLHEDDATHLVDASKGVRFGHELEVLKYAHLTFEYPDWYYYPGEGNGARRWLEKSNLPDTDLSVPRLEAVKAIIERWREMVLTDVEEG